MNARILPAALLLLAGCGGEVVVGGFDEGEVETYMTSTPAAPAASGALLADAQPAESPAPPAASAAAAAAGFANATAQVWLVAEGGRLVAATRAPIATRFRLAGDTVALDRVRVPAGRYTAARVVFQSVTAELTGGVAIPGLPLPAMVTVAQGLAPMTIEAPIRLDVAADARYRLLVDLRAAQWLRATDPLSRTVSEAAFRQAVQVRLLP